MNDRTTEVVKEILGRLGIEDVSSYDVVRDAVDAELERRGFRARVSGIRWGCVTVGADRSESGQLDWMRQPLEEVVRKASKGTVTSIRIRTERAGYMNQQPERKQP